MVNEDNNSSTQVMMTKKRLIQILLFCAVLLATSSAMAETLRIVTIALPPYGYIDNKTNTGLNYEIGDAIALEAGFVPENNIVPLARGMEEISTGHADMIIMFPNPKINADARNLGMILPMETVIIARAGTVLRSLRDVRGKRVGSVRGAKYDDRVTKESGIILYPTDSYSQSLKMLLAGRVDAIIGPKLGLYYTAKTDNIPKQALGKPLVLSVSEGSVFISNKTPDSVAQQIGRAMSKLMKNGRIQQILSKYSL